MKRDIVATTLNLSDVATLLSEVDATKSLEKAHIDDVKDMLQSKLQTAVHDHEVEPQPMGKWQNYEAIVNYIPSSLWQQMKDEGGPHQLCLFLARLGVLVQVWCCFEAESPCVI